MSVCLVGSWAKIPNGDDAHDMAQNIFLNRDNITSIPEDREYLNDFREKHPDVKAALVEGIDQFDDQYFGTGESEAICMDPQQRMLMQGVIQALENAGITIEMASEARVSVYTAAWAYDYKDLLPPDQYMATGNSASVMCGRITYFLNSRGAAVGIETACSSSLVAFHLARQAILNGETKLALVCGANHVGSRSFHSLYNSHMVSPNGRLAAFDRSANGFVRAESFAVAVLCSKEFAIENNLNIHCECIGSAFNSDGKTPSLTAPNPISQYEVQIEAMGKLDKETIQLVTCHGTGTKLGDQIEVTAIKTSFKPDIRVMSPKSSMGHGEGAAGLIGVLQSLYSLEQALIPNQLHLQLPTEDLGNQVSMAFVNEEMDLKRVAISSYGFGGTNACAIIEKPSKNSIETESYAETNVLFLSAKNQESLQLKIEDYSFFMEQTDSDLNDILFTVNERKTKYDIRAAVFGRNREEIVKKLKNKDYCTSNSNEGNDEFIVEFGEGNEKLWLLRMLYESNDTFHKAVDKYCELAESCGFAEARTALFFPFKLTLTPLTYNVSRLISSLATFELLIQYDTMPTKIRGRGLGQIFCLAAAKSISFEDAVQLIKAVVAENNISECLSSITLKPSKIPIEIQKERKTVKKILPIQVIDEIKLVSMQNLMSFTVNGQEVLQLDPVKKVQHLICQLFVNGYDPKLKFKGTIVKTPGYSFLKRKFWPQPLANVVGSSNSNETTEAVATGVDVAGIYDNVKEIVRKFLDIEEDDVNLLETGAVDSLTSIEMIEAIGTSVGQTMPFDLLENYPTTQNIVEYLKTVVVNSKSNETKIKKSNQISSGNSENVDVNVIAADFMFAGVDGEKELWDTLLTSKIVTGKMSETRKNQCEGDAGLEVGLLKQDISMFDNAFFSIAKDEAEFVDPQHRLLLHSAYNAMEKSGLASISDSDLFLAISSHSEYRTMAEKLVDDLDERLWMGTVHSMAAGRLASLLGIRGKAVLVDTTCSSIATALEMAVESIRAGKKYAVVATSQLIQSQKWLYSLRTLLDHHNTKSFDASGTGFCRSDGVGVIILKAAEPADIAFVKITNAKTHHSGAVITPVVGSISQLLDGIGPVSYVEGHGTATIAGDSAESLAYQKINQEIVMSSVKAQFGHCEVASGMIQLMKVSSLSKNGIIPAIVHNSIPNEHIRNNENLRLPFVSEECDVEKSAVVSFGITGTKTIVCTESVNQTKHQDSNTCYLFPVSAKTKDGLKKAIESFVGMLELTNESLHDISTMMQKQKTSFKWRTAVVGSNHSEVVKKFKKILNNENEKKESNFNVCTTPYSIGCTSFMSSIPEFEEHYTNFCNRMRFIPHSDSESTYHIMAVVYSLIKTILKHKTTNTFAVSGFSSLVILAAIDAAPTHYINDLIHAFANNDVRMMKRIARDVTIQIENVEVYDLNGKKITTARDAVDAAVTIDQASNHRFSETTLFLTQHESLPYTSELQNIKDYYQLISQNFTQGAAIDFENIFGKSTRIIELPEYPFNRKSFWLPIRESRKNIETTVAPKIQMNYEFLLNSDKWKHVKNHVVDAKVVLPGATSIRLVYELHGENPIVMSNIDFLNKITPNEKPILVKQKNDNDMWTLSCDTQDAICFKLDTDRKYDAIPNQPIKSEIYYVDEIYQRFSASQLTYRNEFQMLDTLRYSAGKGDAQFVEMQNLDILIDGTLQAIVSSYFFENPQDQDAFVPFTIDKIVINNGNIKDKQLKTMLRYESSTNFVTGDATVYDAPGNVVLHISNVTFKRLNSPNAPIVVSKTVAASKLKKGVENETAKREARNTLHTWFEDNFGWTDIDDTTGFFDLGLTSIQAVKLRNSIKSNYPNASSTCVFDYPSIQQLSGYLSTLVSPLETGEEEDVTNNELQEETTEPTRVSLNPIGVMAAACRLPGGVSSPAELWELLKIGKNASSRIPATRIPTRNNLIAGTKYGNPVEGGNFITQDVTQFDPSFFKISKSEAELIDPQQRILLECVQECLENSGVTETNDVGVFVGLMEKEYQDMMESSSILAMLGSMAAVIAGRVNYVFGCHGPSVTIDTACSSSLVALEMAVNALLDKRCSKVIVAGVNLILNEKGQGLRTNGKMLSQHGMSLSFDSRASGYGRSDGCVVLMLELAKPNFHYMSTIQAVNVNHGGRSVSLTAPNGVAHKMLLTSIINQSPSLSIDYWEAHGTGTPLGDPIEFNTLSSILQNILIGSVKASLGHGEASAGTCGLLKLFLMLTYQYVPTLIHFHILNKDINAGSIRLPIIGEDADLVSAGISSFGVSGTNAAAIAFNDNNKLEPYNAVHKKYILPISAKNQTSLDELEKHLLAILPLADAPINDISSALANNRAHFTIRNALIVSSSGYVIRKVSGKPQRLIKKEKIRVKLSEGILDPTMMQYDLINETYTVASLKNPADFAMKFALIKFIQSISQYIEVIPSDTVELLAVLLANGSLKWEKFNSNMLELPIGSLLNELADRNLSSNDNIMAIKNYHNQPEAKTLQSPDELFDMIVQMYVTGYELEWSNIYPPVQRFVALPNYYFNKQTLWFEDRGEIVDHYLIGTVDESTDNTSICKNLISELRHRQLFNGKPIDVGTIVEMAIAALKVQQPVPFSIQNMVTSQITLTQPVWLKTVVSRLEDDESTFEVKGYIDDQSLFSMTASIFESENIELPVVEVQIPEKVVHLSECPSAIIRRHRNTMYVDSRAEVSPFRTANLVLNEIIGFTPTPSDMFFEILGVLPDVYYMVQVDDGALWQFQILSHDKHVLSNIYVLKDAKGLEVPTLRMHKKSTLLSSQEASSVALKTLQTDIRNKVRCAFNDVIDTGIDVDESQLSTGFSELGMDSLATVDLLNRLNQKYFPEIELTTSDLFDNPNIIDLAVKIEELLNEKGISLLPSAPQTPKSSVREIKLSIPAMKHQELAQIEFVEQYNQKMKEPEKTEPAQTENVQADRIEIRRKISLAVFDLATDTIQNEDLDTKGFTELGMDSLSIVDFVNRLNEKYFPGEEITASDIFDYPTVDELADHITRKKSMAGEPVKVNGNIESVEKQIEEKLAIHEILDQSYMLVDDHKDFQEDLIIYGNVKTIELKTTEKVLLILKSDGGQDDDLKKLLFNKNNCLISMDYYDGSVEHLYMAMLNFVKTLVKNKIQCVFKVSNTFSLGNTVARAFMKTISSEKYPLIAFEWDQKIQQVTFEASTESVSGSWLITGGLSGIGFEIGRFLSENGAENVILISRRKPSQQVLQEIKQWKTKVHTIAADIGDKDKMISELEKLKIKVNNVIHSAGVLKDSKIERQTLESFNQVFKPKADGVAVLEAVEQHFNYKLDNFIMMSSFTAACGNEGQLNYGVSNAYLEHQVLKRRMNGKSGCAIQWGNWIDTGMATSAAVRKFLEDLGFLGQKNEVALKYLKACIEIKPVVVMVANIDWNVILKNRKDLPRDLILKNSIPFEKEEIVVKKNSAETESLNDTVSIDIIVEDEDEVLEVVKNKVCEMIKTNPNKIKNNKSIMDIGLDSKLLTQLLFYINSTFNIQLNLTDVYNYSTLDKLAAFIWVCIQKQAENKITAADEPKNQDFCPILGFNIFFDEKTDFESAKSKAIEILQSGKELPVFGKFAFSVIGNSMNEIIQKIEKATVSQIKTCQPRAKSVMMLTGQGSQYPMMGRQLCENFEIFKITLQQCLEKCDEHLKGDVRLWEILFNTDHYQLLQLTKHMQPIMFSFGYALAQLWLSLGVVPDYYLGHSVGELAAAVLSGVMTIDDGLKLIVERGKAMENIAGLGALLAVQREIADDVLRNYSVCVATLNSPKQVVFAGKKDVLDKALAFVKSQGKQGTFVNQKYPFHSNLIQESHLVDLRKCLKNITFKKPQIPLVSNVTGQIVENFSEEYVIKHTISAVKFVNCVETLEKEGVTSWIDAGPAAVLATFLKRIIEPAELSKHRIVQTCKEKENDVEMLIQACLELEQTGVKINFNSLYGCDENKDEKVLQFPISKHDSIKVDEYEVLEGHRLNGKVIIAGAYQLVKMNHLVAMSHENMMLKNIKFLKPWYVEDKMDYEVRWNANMTIELIVKSEAVCSASVTFKNGSLPIETVSNQENEFSVHEFYEALYSNGLQYEEGFRRIEKAKRSEKRCFASLKPSLFPWPLIDSAMHSITASVIPRRPDCYFLPVAMGTVAVMNESHFQDANLHSHAVITSEADKFIQVNVVLYAGEQAILEIRNMTIVVLKLAPDAVSPPTAEKKIETSEIQIVGFDITLPYNQMSTNHDAWQHLKTSTISNKLRFRHANTSHVNLLDVNVRCWDPEYFGIRPSEAHYLDPQQRLLLTSVAKLLDATKMTSLPTSTGVFIGCSTHEFSHVVYAHSNKTPYAEWGGGTANSATAGRIAHWLKLQGPVATLDTACSSSFHALSMACDALKLGKCEYALVGTINLLLHEMTTKVLDNAQMTVHDFCKTFDVDAKGYKRSESVCTMLLTNNAAKPSLGQLLDWQIGHNGNSSSLFSPNGKSQYDIMKKCTRCVERIDHVEMHCTGTSLGDPIELNAVSKLENVSGSVSSIKSNIGHCEGASGMVSLCTTLLNYQNAYQQGQLHLKLPNETLRKSGLYCKFVGGEIVHHEQNVLINNFGFTGSNCSVLVNMKRKNSPKQVDDQVYYPMFLSAHTETQMTKYEEKFKHFVGQSSSSLLSIAHSLKHRKRYSKIKFLVYNYKRKCVFDSAQPKEFLVNSELSKMINESMLELKSNAVDGNIYDASLLVDLPDIEFKSDYYWKLEPYSDEVGGVNNEEVKKSIYYEKYLLKADELGLKEHVFFANITEFYIADNTIEELMRLIGTWNQIGHDGLLLICCRANNTMHTEWTGAIRSMAAEKLINYKFVSYDNHQQLEDNKNIKDIYEMIFYRNNVKFVERMTRIDKLKTRNQKTGSILMSGGTGGVGKAVLEYLDPPKAVITTRKHLKGTEKIEYCGPDEVDTWQHFNQIFHFAGITDNVSMRSMKLENIKEVVSVKLNGAQALMKKCRQNSEFVFSSSIASILGSYGQVNYAFANGLVTSYLESLDIATDIIHWGPWKEVGMLAKPERADIVNTLRNNGWEPLQTADAISILKTEKSSKKRQIIVFDGDFEKIVKMQPHLRPFLSGLIAPETNQIHKLQSFEEIFEKITGIQNACEKVDTPFMDLGIDSLCMETLRYNINNNMNIDVSVSDMFENACFSKLKKLTTMKQDMNSRKQPQAVSDKQEESNEHERIAVIGWSAEFSGAKDINEFWTNLQNGVVSTTTEGGKIRNPYGFDNKFFNITDEDAKVLDPQVKKFIQHAYLALENSGYIKERKTMKCAVFAGSEPSEYGRGNYQDDAMRQLFVMNMNNYLATYAAYCLDLNGEAVSVYSACSTTLVAITHAVRALLDNSAELALVGAASISTDSEDFDKKTIFSSSGVCRPFDRDSEGIVRGSGVGCLVLKKLSQARKDEDNIHFVIENIGTSNDGNSRASFMAPNPAGQLKCMTECLNQLSDSERRRIEYIECHATGTALGDTIELHSLQTAYSFKRSLKIGSCKANIGHAYAASGLAALIKSAMILKTGIIPKQVGFQNMRIDFEGFFDINKEPHISPNARIGINSFGIGGTNVHMIISKEERRVIKQSKVSNFDLIPISSKTKEGLTRQKIHIMEELNQSKSSKVNYFELWNRRKHYAFREIIDSRRSFHISQKVIQQPNVCFFFAPQGLQYANILPEDMQHADEFWPLQMKDMCNMAQIVTGQSFNDILFKTENQIDNPLFSQVALFIQCISIYETLRHWNIKPSLLVGHSIGEYTAAVASGIFTHEAMIELLFQRSKLVTKTKKAVMFLVWDTCDDLIEGVYLCSHVESNLKCVVGDSVAMKNMELILIARKIRFKEIPAERGFHSQMMIPILNQFRSLCDKIIPADSKIPIISSIDGNIITNFNTSYCSTHLTTAVNMQKVVDNLVSSNINIIVEIGPSGILANLLAQRGSDIVVIPTCGKKKKPIMSLKHCIGTLWAYGVVLRMPKEYKCSVDGNTPGYVFEESILKNEEKDKRKNLSNTFHLYTECWNEVYLNNQTTEKDSILIHHLDIEEEERLNNYFHVEKLLQNHASTSMTIFVSNLSNPYNSCVIGMMRCHQLKTNTRLVYVETDGKTEDTQLIDLVHNTDADYLRIVGTICFQKEYKLADVQKQDNNYSHVVVFGANGFVGQTFVKYFNKLKCKVFEVSRSSSSYPCDITNYTDVEKLFKKLGFTTTILIVNCVGKETSPTIFKSKAEQTEVLNVKCIGNINILEAVAKLNVKVDKFITCSSLSSVIPMLGNEDYASSNCFVDAITRQQHKNIRHVISLALPPLKESRMYSESSDSTRSMLETISMKNCELEKVIDTILSSNLTGPVFIAPENPKHLAKSSSNFYKTDENDNKIMCQTANDDHKNIGECISDIWREAIGLNDNIKDNDNFFFLGGDSLNALQVVWQIQKRLNKVVNVNAIFDHPVFESFVKFVEFTSSGKVENLSIDINNIPLTNAQTQMHLLRQIDATSKYNIVFRILITKCGNFDWEIFKRVIHSLIAYQHSYRTMFRQSHQEVCSLTESFYSLDFMDNVGQIIKTELDFNFDFEKCTPLRIIASKCDNDQIHIIFNQHHILTDGWSMTILANTINRFYDIYVKKSVFPQKLDQCLARTACIERKHDDEEKTEKATMFYGAFEHSVIPYDLNPHEHFSEHRGVVFEIPTVLWDALQQLSKQYSTTAYNISLGIFCQTIYSFTNQLDILFGFADSGRNSENSELIGYCMNNLLFKCQLSDNGVSFATVMDKVIKSLDTSREFKTVPFHKLVEKNRKLNAISIYFNFRQKLDFPNVSIPGAKCDIEHISVNNAFDLSFTIDETPGGPILTIDYDGKKYLESTMQSFATTFLKKLNTFSKTADILLIRERSIDIPRCLMNTSLLVEMKTNYLNAIQTGSRTTTYSRLSSLVEDISKNIERQFQVKMADSLHEDDIIGIDGSVEQILSCCLLGVSYSPIDDQWPEERKMYVSKFMKLILNRQCKSVKMRTFNKRTQYGGIYTIFTSGSTGVPKGVFMAEQSVSLFLKSSTKLCGFRQELKVLDSVKPVFDVSVSNIFGSLLNQSTLIQVHGTHPESVINQAQYAFLPAAIFNGFTKNKIMDLRNLTVLTVGGESLSDDAIQKTLEACQDLQLVQIYGPTETCVWSVTNKCVRSPKQGTIIGRPVDGENCKIVGNTLRGELKIDGLCVARGYLRLTEVTGKPFDDGYLTGDIVEHTRNKRLRYIGRCDNQVKWKGHRIDISEVEKEVLSGLSLQQCKILLMNKLLIAFFVSDASKMLLSEIRHCLRHMLHIPDYFVQLDKLPLNSSGKICKEKLLQTFDQIRKSYKREMVKMVNSVEEKVLTVVAESVGQKCVLVDKFTNIGGNSLSAMQIAHKLTEVIGTEVKAHDVLQSNNFVELSDVICGKMIQPNSTVDGVITKLREVPNSKFSIYIVHAIGGTIYPYYSFLQIFPKNISIYGIEYDLKYPSENLRDLSQFYAREIAAHAGKKQIFVMGHSMGGIMSREIVTELKIWGYQIPFVMLFDSWVLRTNELDIENIKQFITYVFSGLPDSEHRIDRAIKLAEILREYTTAISDTKLYLFKSKQLGDAAFKKAVRSDLNEELSRSMTCNGFDELSLQPIETFLIDGDHESCLKVENLRKVKDQILAPFQPYM